MLELGLLDETLDGSYFHVNESFKSNILMPSHDTFIKIFTDHVPNKILVRKERILRALYFSKIHDKYQIIPEVYRLLYKKNGIFAGYTMAPFTGKRLDEFCADISLVDTLIVFQNLEATIKTIHSHGFCLTDFNSDNILVSRDNTIKLIDIDSFCFINDTSSNMFGNYKYTCPYSKYVNQKYNSYSFYSLLIDTIFKMNLKDNKRSEILEKIMQEKSLTEPIKEKLVHFVNIQNKLKLQQLDYLF